MARRKQPSNKIASRANAGNKPGDERRAPNVAGRHDAARFGHRARPWLLAAATAVWGARLLFPSESVASQGDGLPAVMVWITLAVVWLLGEIGQPRFRFRFGWVDGAVLLLVTWHTIAAVWAAAHLSPRPAVNMLWEWIGFGVSFFLIRQLLAGPREARALVAVMGSMAVALSAYGLYQYKYEMPATRAAFEADPEGTLAAASLYFPPGSSEGEMFRKRLESVEPIATFALTNSLAGLLAPCLILLVGIAAIGRPEVKQGLALWGPIACALVLAACLLLTKSRSACLAVVFGLVLVGVAWRRKSARIPWKFMAWTILVAAALVGGAIAVGGLDIEVLSEAGKSLGYRGQYWRSSLAMIADHPLLGCGPGNFQDAYKAYKLPEASEEIAEPHNFLIEIWTTAGTPAMLALLAALAGFFGTVVRGKPEGPPAEQESEGPPPTTPGSEGREFPGFVYGGGLLGFAAAVPIGIASPAPPSLVTFAVTIPVACFSAAVLWRWVVHGRLSAGLAAIAVAALLVNLSAAGGISFAGVAGSLWLLMAIGLNISGHGVCYSAREWVAFVGLAFMGSVAYACYASAYGPVLRSQAALERAQRHPLQMEQHLLEAAAMDRLAAEPWYQLAAKAAAEWELTSNGDALRRFEQYNQTAIDKAPNSVPAWAAMGDRYLQIYKRTKDSGHLHSAIAAMRRTVELYPNSATNRAKLAIALHISGDEEGFRSERDKAIWLDKMTPHLDKKLPDELRKSLERSNSRQN